MQTIAVLEAEKAEVQTCLKKNILEIEGLRGSCEHLWKSYSVLNKEIDPTTTDSRTKDNSNCKSKCKG